MRREAVTGWGDESAAIRGAAAAGVELRQLAESMESTEKSAKMWSTK